MQPEAPSPPITSLPIGVHKGGAVCGPADGEGIGDPAAGGQGVGGAQLLRPLHWPHRPGVLRSHGVDQDNAEEGAALLKALLRLAPAPSGGGSCGGRCAPALGWGWQRRRPGPRGVAQSSKWRVL